MGDSWLWGSRRLESDESGVLEMGREEKREEREGGEDIDRVLR